MAAPFNSDDMMQRSLFGAIFGFKKNDNSARSRASSVDQHPDVQAPGPSWASAPVPVPAQPVPAAVPPVPVAGAGPAPGPDGHFYPPYNPHVFPGPHPPLPVLTAQCPYAGAAGGRRSYASLAHQAHAPDAAYAPYAAPPPAYSPYPPQQQQTFLPADHYKTKADIYREIVNECEEFERSNTTTPLVESSPATPTVPSGGVQSPRQWQQQQYMQQPINDMTSNFSMMDLPPSSSASFHDLDQQRVASILQQQLDVKPLLPNQMSIEELVKFVVKAVKETNASPNAASAQSPEEILKRKRQMNNEAAARYRKRQREEKDKQHVELDGLEQRNQDLRRTVDDMEREIAVLKKYVLEQSRIAATVPKVEQE